jgi:hypothetical protein
VVTTQPSYSTGRLWAGRLLGLGFVLLAALVATVTVPELRSELAGEGTKGTLTVSSCESHTTTRYRKHRRTTQLKINCTGTWAADDGKSTYDQAAVETSSRLETGTKIPVIKVDDTFEQPQDRAPGKDIAILALCLSLLAFGAYCLLTGFGVRNGPDVASSWQRLPARGVTGLILGALFIAGVLGVLVGAFIL